MRVVFIANVISNVNSKTIPRVLYKEMDLPFAPHVGMFFIEGEWGQRANDVNWDQDKGCFHVLCDQIEIRGNDNAEVEEELQHLIAEVGWSPKTSWQKNHDE